MKNLFVLLTLISITQLFAASGDTTHVIPHNAVTVVTDPNTGANSYKRWAIFPSPTMPVRKIVATLTYKCAPGMACGAWDYLDHIYIRRTGGQAQPSKDIECVRFITPYGNQFNSTWDFSWHMDVTDYAMFLRDSVEIEYIHTGYESTTVGWSVTIDFAFIEGTPVADPISFTQLWNGSFPYGNSSNSIENYLTPDTVIVDSATAYTKLRLLHTGHGSDANYCSEFCSKFRTIKIDNAVMNTRARWRRCGHIALYPQGGTWVYDRGNWCPGDMVYPDFTTSTSLTPGPHVFDMDMQSYIVSSPSANEVVNGQVFQYKAPNSSVDASIEEVYHPSRMDEYVRLNPICTNPLILVRNNGSVPVTSITFKYGLQGFAPQSYTWNGNLGFGDTSSVMLPNFVLPSTTLANSVFEVYIDQVNSQPDQYPYDDSAAVRLSALPPVYDTALIVVFRTNNYLENSYYVTDENGTVVWSRLAANLLPNTTYMDTLHLAGGCYDITMHDAGGDGLYFWANTAQGGGLYRLKRLYQPNTVYLKIFGLDFGSFIKYQFFAVPGIWTGISEMNAKDGPQMDVYPNPVERAATVEYSCEAGARPVLWVLDALGRTLREERLAKSEDFYSLDFSNLSSGVYWLRLLSEGGTAVKKVVKQ